MRELTVRIRFVKHCLGGVKTGQDGRWVFLRNPATQAVMFLAAWHRSNLRFAAQLLGRHHGEVTKILWDMNVDGVVLPHGWFHRYHDTQGGKKGRRYAVHEAFLPGQVVGLNCVVPQGISDDDLWQLMRIAGQYKGISPGKPGEYGQFEVVSIRPRRSAPETTGPEALPTPPAPC